MQISQIRIQSRDAQIQLNRMDAKMEIEQPKADLSIQQPKADLSIQTKPGKLTIDQSQARAEMNLKTISQLNREFGQEGKQAAQEGITRRAQEGSEMMQIENGGSPLISQAVNRAFPDMKQLGITFIPSHFSVKLNYQPTEVKIETNKNKPIIESKQNKPIIQYQKGEVDVSLKQRSELEIDFVNITI